MKYYFFISLLSASFLFSCSSDAVKEKINSAGDLAGQTVGEFSKGLGNGVTKAFDVNITLSPPLLARGLKMGKNTVNSETGTDNVLNAYFIFEKDFSETLVSKVFDAKGQEMGRTTAVVEGKRGEAKFVDFSFDQHTNIDSDSKITIEIN
ncbi:MAG: hypothetical protein JWO09_1522 [Bacteroidetes bacterium]|nr:hypothetical protein [Bacteroidota bacterium]